MLRRISVVTSSGCAKRVRVFEREKKKRVCERERGKSVCVSKRDILQEIYR